MVRRRHDYSRGDRLGDFGGGVLCPRADCTGADRRSARLANRNFAVGSLFSFVLGIGLYGLTYLFPVYLAQVRGYDALMIGETMFVSGLVMFVTAPIAGQLNERIDPRFILVAGFIFFAIGTWQMTYVTSDWDFWELLWPQVFRGIGLAAISTWFNDRMDLHLSRLHESVNAANITATEMLTNLAARFQGSDAKAQALKEMMGMVRLQAEVMSYADVFLLLTVIFLGIAVFGLLMKRPKALAAADAGH
jgi:MFS transporter, DHA2 family, multidrug resistance protein